MRLLVRVIVLALTCLWTTHVPFAAAQSTPSLLVRFNTGLDLSLCDTNVTYRFRLPADPTPINDISFRSGAQPVVLSGSGYQPSTLLDLDALWGDGILMRGMELGSALGQTMTDTEGNFTCMVLLDLTPPNAASSLTFRFLAYPDHYAGPSPQALSEGATFQVPSGVGLVAAGSGGLLDAHVRHEPLLAMALGLGGVAITLLIASTFFSVPTQ